MPYPASILYKSTAGRYRPVRVADGPITARCRFIKNAYWVGLIYGQKQTLTQIINSEFSSCLNSGGHVLVY